MKPYIFPHNIGSAAAKALADALDSKRVKPDGKYVPKQDHLIINYGNSRAPAWWNNTGKLFNSFEAVHTAVSKRRSLECMHTQGVVVPEFTLDRADALRWFNQRIPFLIRNADSGSGGEGIVIVDDSYEDTDVPAAPLYVKYVKKAREFRVHIFSGRPIFIQEKKRRTDFPEDRVNWKIRNLDNGFVFCHNDLEEINQAVYMQARLAVAALGLDFGAVDVIWNNSQQRAYVLEVNTAPGLQGETVNKYAEKFKELCDA